MDYKDYYKILQVEKTVTNDELKSQYRKLARLYHPDINKTDKNATAKFAEISEAYEVLSDEAKRSKYDALGSDWQNSQQSGTSDSFDWSKYASQKPSGRQQYPPEWDEMFGANADASDFFRNIFGGSFGGSQAGQRGQDLKADLEISLEEAYHGGSKVLSIDGQSIRIKLRPGIWDGQTIKIKNHGRAVSPGGKNGDLFLSFHLQAQDEYVLRGKDLHKKVPLSVYGAILGTSLEIKTISGVFKLKIPPGTPSGKVFRLPGKGFPEYGSSTVFGDLFLKIELQIPQKLSTIETKMFEDLAALRSEKSEGVPRA